MEGVMQFWLLVLSMLFTSASVAHAGIEIQTVIDEQVSVECFAFVGNVVEGNFGLWYMEYDQLDLLEFAPLDSTTTSIYCHFVWPGGNAHQWFSVFLKSGGPSCGANCSWTIDSTGFALLDPVTNTESVPYNWITGPDPYEPPSR